MEDRKRKRGLCLGVMGFLFVHIMCCLMPVMFKCAYAAGMDFDAALALTNQVGVFCYERTVGIVQSMCC